MDEKLIKLDMHSLLVNTDSPPPPPVDTELINACDSKNAEVVEKLLKIRSADTDSCNYITPGDQGKDYYKVLHFLWDKTENYHDSLMDIIKEGLSTDFYNKEVYGSLFTIAARKGCIDILRIILCKWREEDKEELKIWLTSTKVDGNTSLHYVVEKGQTLDHNFVKTLIIDGDCINVENKDGIRVIDRIPSNIIEDILDECIAEPKGSSNDRKNENYELKMDFSLFVHKKDLNTQNESDFIRGLQNSNSHKHLLLHPLITTFLHIKWQKIKYVWYLNEIFNMLFYSLILFYMFYIRKNSVWFGKVDKETNLLFMRIVITFMGSIILARECIQLQLFKLDYLRSFDNYLEVSILGMTMSMLYSEYTTTQQSIAAWLVILITVEFLLLVEKMHLLQISLYISMFRKVTYNFLRLTSLLIFLVIAFAVSFYLLIQLTPNNETEDEKIICGNQTIMERLGGFNPNHTRKFADSFKDAILKTVTMSTGEFDYSNLDFRCFPAASLLFAVFIFSIFLVAMNLLNGIAISDIQEIQNHASIYQVQDQVECIINFDNFIPFNNWIFRRNHGNKGLIFRNCFPDKTITSYPNRNFASSSVTCEGHDTSDYINKYIYYVIKVIHFISCKICGDVDNFCKDCRGENKENDHACVYRHTYVILPKFVTSLKKIKEDCERNYEKKRTEERLMSIEKRFIEQKEKDNSTKDRHQKLKEIWEQCNKQNITLEDFLHAIENA